MSQVTTSVPAPTDGFARDPKVEQQVAELRELQAKHPEPPWEVVAEEWKWIDRENANWAADPNWPYWGQNIAVYQQRIVGAGTSPLELEIRLAREFDVHPARFAITWIGDYS